MKSINIHVVFLKNVRKFERILVKLKKIVFIIFWDPLMWLPKSSNIQKVIKLCCTCRFHKFLLWIGIPLSQIADTKPNEFCRIVSEFALEYRTTRERVLQQLEKKANHRERNKTRGKMITDVSFNFIKYIYKVVLVLWLNY